MDSCNTKHGCCGDHTLLVYCVLYRLSFSDWNNKPSRSADITFTAPSIKPASEAQSDLMRKLQYSSSDYVSVIC